VYSVGTGVVRHCAGRRCTSSFGVKDTSFAATHGATFGTGPSWFSFDGGALVTMLGFELEHVAAVELLELPVNPPPPCAWPATPLATACGWPASLLGGGTGALAGNAPVPGHSPRGCTTGDALKGAEGDDGVEPSPEAAMRAELGTKASCAATL